MAKFEFKVTKIEDGGKVWTHYIIIRAADKLTAFARIEDIFKLYDKGLKILILGYKIIRRGKDLYDKDSKDIETKKSEMYDIILDMIQHFDCISFDNLAIEQLDIQSLPMFNEDGAWEKFFMGNDGQYTMYIDLVNGEFAKSSTSLNRYPITSDIKEMFEVVRHEEE